MMEKNIPPDRKKVKVVAAAAAAAPVVCVEKTFDQGLMSIPMVIKKEIWRMAWGTNKPVHFGERDEGEQDDQGRSVKTGLMYCHPFVYYHCYKTVYKPSPPHQGKVFQKFTITESDSWDNSDVYNTTLDRKKKFYGGWNKTILTKRSWEPWVSTNEVLVIVDVIYSFTEEIIFPRTKNVK